MELVSMRESKAFDPGNWSDIVVHAAAGLDETAKRRLGDAASHS
jgi:hypothetical protein